ncbi:glycosyltransferase family 39 protein [Bacteroidales bacterium OttesenSCG-928-K03]|nr:glycosyltransferase family 39 protein [Odoribacter sp. OttesenSCG-928-L07]MDL2238923.1 glycosyltransferase family 39 protein [Bacteroidales bacterium OttesenSCG-928-L14]MDL2242892.1 glycosyltransferase family 39 protein [Bacteroidales bacterium OttesenSCG-928-K03]
MKDLYKNLIAIIFIVFLGLLFNHKYLNTFPYQIHAWAQSDRFALSLGFVENDLNFFKPQTYLYNHQFPDKWQNPSETTVTAVEFPMHDYIPAVIMKLLHNNSFTISRVYILIYSFLGLFFLFKLSYLCTKNFFKSIMIILIAATSPIFVYYQAGFLPTIPSLTNTIIGVYFYYLFLVNNRNKNFNVSLIFFTLAAMSRSTFVIPLIAVFCVEFIRIIKKDSKLLPKLAPVFISLIFVFFNLVYNKILRDNFGSIFLSQLMPAESFSEFISLIKLSLNNWNGAYFSNYHYIIFIGIALVSIYIIATRKKKIVKQDSYFILYITTIFIGCAMFLFALIQQFPAHDYYFLDSFYFPIILLMIFFLSVIPDFKNKNVNEIVWLALTLVMIYPLSNKALASQVERYSEKDWSRTEKTYNSFLNSKTLMDNLGISKDAKILVIDCPAPNMPFILMDRKGFVVMRVNEENILDALNWNYDYIVLQNEYYLSRIYPRCPEIIHKINKIGGDDKISIFVLEEKAPYFETFTDFESEISDIWTNVLKSTEVSFSGSHTGLVTQDMLYGLTYKSKDMTILSETNNFVFFNAKFLCQYIDDFHLVLSVVHNNQNIYYQNYSLADALACTQEWENISVGFEIPRIDLTNYEFAIYLYNPGKSRIYFDDFWFGIW